MFSDIGADHQSFVSYYLNDIDSRIVLPNILKCHMMLYDTEGNLKTILKSFFLM